MRVLLVSHTQIVDWYAIRNQIGYQFPPGVVPRPMDELGEVAGRLCYESWDRPNPATAENRGYLANIISQGHHSVLEHASATFYIDGVSRNFTHELIRHRHLSFSEVSQRYVDVSEYPFIEHPGLDLNEAQGNLLDDILHDSRKLYKLAVKGMTRDRTRKEARQAARFVLPSGMGTKILVTGNLRAWRDMLVKRLSPAADAEFRAVAQELLRQLKTVAPNSFQDFPEEGLTCSNPTV